MSPDHYDSVKIAKYQISNRKKSVNLVDMAKESKRDFSMMLKGNDAYRNIQRDNARNDYLRKLLTKASN